MAATITECGVRLRRMMSLFHLRHINKRQGQRTHDRSLGVQSAATGQRYKDWAMRRYAELVIDEKPELLEKGFQYAQQAIRTNPVNTYGYHTLARYHWKRGEREQALQALETALKLDPQNEAAQKLKDEILAAKP